MKWSKKKLLAIAPKMAKEAGIRDYDGKSEDEFVKFVAECEAKGVSIEGLDGEDNVRLAYKAITIKIEDATIVDDGSGDEFETAESLKVADEEEDGEDEDESSKKSFSADRHKKSALAAVKQHERMNTPAIHDGTERRKMKMYNSAVQNGTKYMGKTPLFTEAEASQRFGAAVRVMGSKGGFNRYKELDNDLSIIGVKAGSTSDNAWAANLIIHETSKDMIDNLEGYGALRDLMPVTAMPDGVYSVPRKTANMQFAYRQENGAYATTNPQVGMVELVAKEVGGIAIVSNSLLNDSAFNIGDLVAESTMAGRGEFEDEEYFNGTYGTHGGLTGQMDASSTYDAANTDWTTWSVDKLQAARGKIPATAWKSGKVKLACSTSFLQSVIYRFAMDGGGNNGGDMLTGVTKGVLAWDGIPIVLTEVLPSAFVADQNVAYIGAFETGSKFGEVTGSGQLASSDQAYWEMGQFAWRYDERIAFNFHDMGGTNSQVIALKD